MGRLAILPIYGFGRYRRDKLNRRKTEYDGPIPPTVVKRITDAFIMTARHALGLA